MHWVITTPRIGHIRISHFTFDLLPQYSEIGILGQYAQKVTVHAPPLSLLDIEAPIQERSPPAETAHNLALSAEQSPDRGEEHWLQGQGKNTQCKSLFFLVLRNYVRGLKIRTKIFLILFSLLDNLTYCRWG